MSLSSDFRTKEVDTLNQDGNSSSEGSVNDYNKNDTVSYCGNREDNEEEDLDDELVRIESSARTSRQLSRLITGQASLIEKANDTDEPLPKMGGGRDLPPYPGNKEIYMVTFDGPDDPLHPHNWPFRKKLILCVIVALSALALTLGSAMYSTATEVIMEKFHVGESVATLGTSLFVFGFASGPIVWGPLSELYGRKAALVPSCFGFVCFTFAVATAKDFQTIMICRFFAGFVGAAPLVVAPAAMADFFDAATRGLAMNTFALVVFGGPMLAPILGAFTVKNSELGWRWTSYFSGIVGCLPLVLLVLFFEEPHHPIILARKAEVLRRRTGNWGIQAPIDEVSLSLKEIFENNITRPVIMLFTEPILFLISLYNAFIYGLLYTFLTAIPLIFSGRYGFVGGVAELPYLSMLIGIFIGGIVSLYFAKTYNRAMVANNGKPVPEERLPPMMLGSFFFAGGLFWLGWAGDFPDRVHWIVPTIGASFIGFGLLLIFLPCINYIVDCYLLFAASALAGNNMLRSSFGGAFPLFAYQMFTNMHIKWASTLLGCIAIVLIPVPFLFYKYGKGIRARSKYAFVL
ncbi:uncharacterized protein PRCAT00005030001 [Priceomyces carsonii]|uniref:uncharacterized protein n=1 Tax=Priceomyces carsonii TaxID=28549 RepID=UPI002EDA3CAD|nr:unnamed protein product [Priceomyces carsonii]